MPKFHEFVYWAFLAIISSAAVFGAKSLHELNVNIAVIIEKVATHERQIERHDDRINRIETECRYQGGNNGRN